jgi:prevent-host-death family protein
MKIGDDSPRKALSTRPSTRPRTSDSNSAHGEPVEPCELCLSVVKRIRICGELDFGTTTFNNVTTMKCVGMRQLKTQLARYLRAVEAGDSLMVTVRNRPVAKVIPIHAQGREAEEALNSLMEKGLVRPSKHRPKPLRRALKVRNARISEAVLEDRGAIL